MLCNANSRKKKRKKKKRKQKQQRGMVIKNRAMEHKDHESQR